MAVTHDIAAACASAIPSHANTMSTASITSTTSTSESLDTPGASEDNSITRMETIAQALIQIQSSASRPCGRTRSTRRREQCRVNQARYRARKERRFTKLQASIVALQLDIQRLEYTHRSLYAERRSQETAIQQIVQFSRLFRHGMRVTGSPPASLRHDSGVEDPTAELDTQIALLNQVITLNVLVNDQIGRHHLMTHLLELSVWFHDIQIELVHTLCIPGCPPSSTMVRAKFVVVVHVSEASLRGLSSRFRSVDGNNTSVAGLLGRRVSTELVADVMFDASHQVVSLYWTVDVVGALSKVLPLGAIAVLCSDPPPPPSLVTQHFTSHRVSRICE